MIIITGGAGFIGSNIIRELNRRNIFDIIIVDNLDHPLKISNINDLNFKKIINIEKMHSWLQQNTLELKTIIHLGACSDTLETNKDYLYENNVLFSQNLWKLALKIGIPFIYASSAATYGDGSKGFSDNHDLVPYLNPLNPYGQSKQDFDLWVLKQKETPPLWSGLKYFNVYGPGESHKGRMASVAWHFIQQLEKEGSIKLFKGSHGYDDGEQKRDFIYISDAVKITLFFTENNVESGIYNVGTGNANTFNQMANTIIGKVKRGNVKYIPFPNDLLNTYQANTCAVIDKLIATECTKPVYSISEGIENYLNHLIIN